MAQDRYFDKFPIVNYGSTQVVDIMERVAMVNSVLKNPYLFYPYQISEQERPDQLSYRYYGDQFKSWLLYLANQITDPYYEWYLTEDQFNQFIIAKYGSTQLAMSKTKCYQNNWAGANSINVSAYTALPSSLQKYWQPVYNPNNNKLMNYTRTQINYSVNTNGIRSYTVSTTSFIKDEICNIVFNANNVGQGQFISAANSVIYLQHISGTTTSVNITANSYIYGQQSSVNTMFTTATAIADNFQPDEQIYWSPVTYYDYETQRNEYNKTIKILDASYAQQVANGIETTLDS